MSVNNLFDPLVMCLIRIARDHEISITQEGILSGLPLYGRQLTPAFFARAAERVGLSSKIVNQPLEKVNDFILPAIVILQDNTACVLYQINPDTQEATVYFPELEDTVTKISFEQLQQRYAGSIIYVQQRQFIADNQIKLDQDNKHWFWKVIRANRSLYKDVLVAALFVNIFALCMPLFVMNIYDRVVPNHATDTLWVMCIGIFLVLCADFALKLIRSYFVDLSSSRSDIKLSAFIMERVLGRRMEYVGSSVGTTASTIQSYESIRAFTSSMTLIAMIDLPFFILFLAVIAFIGWPFLIPILIATVLILGYALALHVRMKDISEAMSQASQQRNSFLVESLNAQETIKTFNANSRVQTLWEKASLFVIHYSAKLRYLGGSLGSFAAWVQQSAGIVIILIGVYLIIDGALSQGALIACYLLSTRALAPVTQVAGLITQYYQASSALKMLDDMVSTEQERDQMKGWISHSNLRGDIEFKNVSLQYTKEGQPAVDNVSFKVRAGEKVAILGRIGSGKSTVQKMLLSLYRPTNGAIMIDGENISQIDPAELRSQIGYIPQDIQLLNGTVISNILLGNPHASRQTVEDSLLISGLGQILKSHQDGLNMPVGEGGSKLSGGQRQAIAVARAIAQQANILIFDEPTSAMDSAFENYVLRNLKKYLTPQKTLILVTHKPSLLQLVDRIIIMEDGRIIADGDKDTIMKEMLNKQQISNNAQSQVQVAPQAGAQS